MTILKHNFTINQEILFYGWKGRLWGLRALQVEEGGWPPPGCTLKTSLCVEDYNNRSSSMIRVGIQLICDNSCNWTNITKRPHLCVWLYGCNSRLLFILVGKLHQNEEGFWFCDVRLEPILCCGFQLSKMCASCRWGCKVFALCDWNRYNFA